MKGKDYRIAVVQARLNDGLQANIEKCSDMVRRAAKDGAQVVCLPELYSSFYFCQSENTAYFDLAEPLNGPSFQAFSALAREQKVAVIVPFFERRAAGIYHNSARVIDADGGDRGLYRKMHIPDDPSYYEKFYFTPGDTGFKAFDISVGRIGVLICWDQWYPEGARIVALQGAEVLFYPTAIGWHPREKSQYGVKQHDAWETVQRGSAVANGMYVAVANRVGFERPVETSDGIEFWGGSFIAGPQGEIIAKASHDAEEILIADIDPVYLEEIRRNWPFFRDRRIDAYSDLLKRSLAD